MRFACLDHNFPPGWGHNETLLARQAIVYDPPFFLGFAGGAGGGPAIVPSRIQKSNCLGGFPKPSYQRKLPGKLSASSGHFVAGGPVHGSFDLDQHCGPEFPTG
jgi:hypothetical protein